MNSNKEIITVLKALADETRIEIVRYLIDSKEMPCQELMKKFKLAQPTLSHHFNKLVNAKILNSRKKGVAWFYAINKKYLTSKGININKLVQPINVNKR
jgi:ArsR family transcriptional regulator